ncbi:MAG: glycerol-3-phosphate dehydrogenase [Thiomonas sp.]|nr:glycerol-3-phosphate dehydrogenase [Thiomonas sp.]
MTTVAEHSSSNLSCDVLVVGGGINGAGIARDLAGRGLQVVLCERDDLAAHTSSASTKLIHGGLRYLEYREFGLVRKALQEREVLLRSAPHIMWPLRFVMPHAPAMRPAWMIRAGLFLYDHLARREWLLGSGSLDLRGHAAGEPLKPDYLRGFIYSDGWVDDARLVTLCAVDAAERGATVLTRTTCAEAIRHGAQWQATLRDAAGAELHVKARALVNAAGPWAEQLLKQAVRNADGHPPIERRSLRLVRGSHIVVPRLFAHDHAYIFQAGDGRIVFAIPYERHFTLIGTTDVEVAQPEGAETCSDAEAAYLCTEVNRYFRVEVKPEQIVWRYAGVRPLLEDHAGDAKAATRDYKLELDRDGAPLLTVWGGKITTFRKLAEQAADQLCLALGDPRQAWTHTASLPGGDLSGWIGDAERPDADFARFLQAAQRRYAWLDPQLVQRLARAYGSRIDQVLRTAEGQPATKLQDLGSEMPPGLYEAELRYLQQSEWARSADDVLWRRSKLGLHLGAAQQQAVRDWFNRA